MSHSMHTVRPCVGLVLVLMLAPFVGQAQAQEHTRITVVIEQLAGSNVYLRAGIAAGISAEDTLDVQRTPDGPVLGHVRVVSSSENRSVVTFIGTPVPLTRGDSLHLSFRSSLPGAPTEPRASQGQAARDLSRRQVAGPTDRVAPRVSGQLSFDFSSIHTVTEGLGSDPEKVTRDFTTPTTGIRLQVTQLPGGLEFNTSARASYRSSSNNIIAPSTSVRVYQASLEKSFQAVPVSIQLGRFYNRYESYSGYWDGVLLHYGKRLGIGAAAGFEPDRLNQGFSSTLPKYSVFLDYRYHGPASGYSADVSFHQVRPDDGTPEHTFAGLSQRARVKRFSVSQNLQVDQNPESGRWVVTRAQARASVPIGRRGDFHAGYTLRQPYQFGRSIDIIPFRRDHITAGLTIWAGRNTLNTDVGTADQAGRARYYNVSSSLRLPATGFLGLDLMVAGSYWTEAADRGLLLSPTFSRSIGGVRTRVNYQYYRSQSERATIVSHAADLSLSFSLVNQIRSTIRARISQGDKLTSTGIYTSLWVPF